jgi:Bacterial Ig-like domain (group 3)/FG-GAP-like repeat
MERKAECASNLTPTWLLLGLLFVIAGFALANAQGNAARPDSRENDIVAPALAKPLLLPAVPYNSGGSKGDYVTVGDLNHDGYLDIVTADECGSICPNGGVSVLMGNGNGTFQPAVLYDSGGISPGSIAIADVNGDGLPDVVVGNACVTGEQNCGGGGAGDGNVGVLFGNGDGTLQPVVVYDAGGRNPSAIAIADINRDGTLDLIVANNDPHNPDGRLGILLGNGDGTFKPVTKYNPGGCNYQTLGVAVADLNGDGNPDVVVANGMCAGYEGSVAVLLGNGDGTLKPASNYDSGAEVAIQVSVADLNSDGKPDLLVSNLFSNNAKGNGKVSVLLGNGDGTFQVARTYDTGEYATTSLAVGDLNGDGKLDVVASSECDVKCNKGGVSVLEGLGDGTFKVPIRFDPILSDGPIVVADVNRDGRPDVLVSNQASVRVLLNNPLVLGTSKTTLTSSINPSQLHQSVTFTAHVTASDGVIKDGEAVTFFDGSVELKSVPLMEGTAVYTTSALSVKTHTIKAIYGGDLWLKKSTGQIKQVVQQ